MVSARVRSHDAGQQAERPSEIPVRGWFDIAKRTLAETSSDNGGLIAAVVAF